MIEVRDLIMKRVLENMWEGESVRIDVTTNEESTVAWVFTHRMAVINGKAYTVANGYIQLKGRDVEYAETRYIPFREGIPETNGTILHRDPAPHPERNKE